MVTFRRADKYYPVRIGQMLDTRYVGKLEFGLDSTLWLARDMTRAHLAGMAVMMGPLPPELLKRDKRGGEFFYKVNCAEIYPSQELLVWRRLKRILRAITRKLSCSL